MKTKVTRKVFIVSGGAATLIVIEKEQKMIAKETITIRKAGERGVAEHGWLHSKHTFSFADYYDPKHMGYRSLRVINDDRVEPGEGFGTHPHRDMEIISYVVKGELEHKDSMGNGSIIRPGDVQRMSAGSGVTHSEFNPQPDQPAHFLQIWIQPAILGITPGYEQKNYSDEEKTNRLRLVASPDGADGSVSINQDARLYATLLQPGHTVATPVDANRSIWVQLVKGKLTVNGETIETGDGAAIENAEALTLTGIENSEVLVFELA
jgi:redox-sensitive bicupin YhaK (pirin superfamily)